MKTFRRIGAILMLMMLVVLTPVQGVLAKYKGKTDLRTGKTYYNFR